MQLDLRSRKVINELNRISGQILEEEDKRNFPTKINLEVKPNTELFLMKYKQELKINV